MEKSDVRLENLATRAEGNNKYPKNAAQRDFAMKLSNTAVHTE